MEKLTIYYGIQGNGMRFNLMVQHYKTIKTLFPNAQPAKGIFVEYDMRSNFADYHPQLERHVFPALVGVVTKDDLARFKRIEFVKTPELTITYTIEQNEIVA
jgi:ethanolamine utilization protein EutP (predicted NTPase)